MLLLIQTIIIMSIIIVNTLQYSTEVAIMINGLPAICAGSQT